MSYQFQRWIITLGARIRSLQESLSLTTDVQKLSREAAHCEAELQHLYAYAQQYHLDLLAYYHPFTEIEQQLHLIHDYLRDRQVQAE
jgi:hypothetical protein